MLADPEKGSLSINNTFKTKESLAPRRGPMQSQAFVKRTAPDPQISFANVGAHGKRQAFVGPPS